MEAKPSEEARLSHLLSVQSHQIEKVMSHHQIPATVVGGKVNHRTVNFDLQTYLTDGLGRVRGLFDDLRAALGVEHTSLSNKSGRWQLQVARPAEPAVSLIRLQLENSNPPPMTAIIGLAEGEHPVMLRFGPKYVHHVLIAGDSGAGKTTLLRTIGAGLAMANRQSGFQLLVLDPCGNDNLVAQPLRPLSWLPHMLTDPAVDVESCQSILHFLVEEMEYRRKEHIRQPNIVTLVDHLVTLIEQSQQAAQDIIRLLQFGPQAGIHLVLSTSRPDSPRLDTSFRTNLSIRLVGRINQSQGPRRIAGITLDQVTALIGGGDFIAASNDKITYFQAAAIDDYDLHLTLTELIHHKRPRLLAYPYDPRVRLENKSLAETSTQSFIYRDGSIEMGSIIQEEILLSANELATGDKSRTDRGVR